MNRNTHFPDTILSDYAPILLISVAALGCGLYVQLICDAVCDPELPKSYIARSLRERLGQKPSEYINSIGISAAKAMLINTELDVTDIAEKAGCSDVY